ncbi:MAG: YhbY family RNA-binding protein [Alkalibacterium sp.]|nr:YhbY family RNA-binding protein [Alkalibacterium sp.]
MNLTGKQKRFLRAEANTMSPIFQIGKNGLTVEMVKEFEDSLDNKELMKVQLAAEYMTGQQGKQPRLLEESSDITVVQKIGKVLVLLKPSDKENISATQLVLPESTRL